MHPIVALWCHPRSMSTAFERLMRARGDLACAHEPFMYDYYIHRGVRRFPHFEPEADRPIRYPEIRDDLLARGRERPVFFKDMAFYVGPQILEDGDFARRLTHLFLIREPERAILSYWRLDPEMLLEEIGLEAQWRLYSGLRARGLAPRVLKAEAIQADPEGVIGALWAAIGLAPAPHAFDWRDAPPPAAWDHVAGWHEDVSRSAGLRPPTPKDPEAFAKAAAEAPRLAELLAHHRPFYDRLAEAAS